MVYIAYILKYLGDKEQYFKHDFIFFLSANFLSI